MPHPAFWAGEEPCIIRFFFFFSLFCCDKPSAEYSTQLLPLNFSLFPSCALNFSVLLLEPWPRPPLIEVWSCRPALSPHGEGDIILGVTWSTLLPIWRPLPASRLSGGAGPLCCRSLSYHTLGCRNSAFVMAVISLLCSQVELRWILQAVIVFLSSGHSKKYVGFWRGEMKPAGPWQTLLCGEIHSANTMGTILSFSFLLCSAEP